MKYLSFVVPSYNVSKYLSKCLDTLVFGGDDVEIIVVNDGSTDDTLSIANKYQQLYPNIIKVVDKENGGHGSTLNTGIQIATGLYFKCVDADDWVDETAYKKVLETIKKHYAAKTLPDLYVHNFVYENLDVGEQFLDTHKDKFPVDQICGFKDIKKFKLSEYLMMHNIIYKLDIIKESKMVLPEHTYYIDNLFYFIPLPYVKTLYYIDADFYRYYVGRADQSVNFANMTKNYKMQIKVMEEMSLKYSLKDLKKLDKKHYQFIIHEIAIISHLTLFYVAADYTKEKKQDYKAYLKSFKKQNPKLYAKIKYRSSVILPFLLIPPMRRRAIMRVYHNIINKTHWN